jgi:hypothetical protein
LSKLVDGTTLAAFKSGVFCLERTMERAIFMPIDRFSFVIIVLLLLSCDGATPPDPTTTTTKGVSSPERAIISASISPDPVSAVLSGDPSFPWLAEWISIVSENAGLGADVNSIDITVRDNATGLKVGAANVGSDDIIERVGTNYVQGRGSISIPLGIEYELADWHVLLLTTKVRTTDDRGNDQAVTAEAEVKICVPELLSPESGFVVDNGCTDGSNAIRWEFDWSECSGSRRYHLVVTGPQTATPHIDLHDLRNSSYAEVGTWHVSQPNLQGWRWRVRAEINSLWSDWSPEQTFDVEPANTDCPGVSR